MSRLLGRTANPARTVFGSDRRYGGGTDTSDRWFYLKDGQRFGPFGAEQFRQLAASGLLLPTDMVLDEADGKWTSAGTVPGLFPRKGSASGPAPAARDRGTGPAGKEDARAGVRSAGHTRQGKKSTTTNPPNKGGRSQPAQPSVGGSSGLVGVIVFALVVSGLVSLGVVPISCAKKLPYVGQHYATFCESCNGTGRVKTQCRACFGHGYYGGVRCLDCGGAGKVGQVCGFCAGSGKKPAS